MILDGHERGEIGKSLFVAENLLSRLLPLTGDDA